MSEPYYTRPADPRFAELVRDTSNDPHLVLEAEKLLSAGRAVQDDGLREATHADEIKHALDSINAALDKASYGDSVEGDLLEAHATLDSLLGDAR